VKPAAKIPLYYEVDEGESGRPYALLVHGMLSSRAQWLPNLGQLRTVCRPVIVELLGHGRSGAPDELAAYRPQAYVEYFEAIREVLGVERWLVLGQSLGAALTLRYTLQHPERVIAQVFTNSASALADPERWAAVSRGSEKTAAAVLEHGTGALEQLPIHPVKARRLPGELRDALVADAAAASAHGIALTLLHTIPTSSVRDQFATTERPTLMAVGTREESFQPSAAFARAALPQLEVLELDAGHAVNVHAADAFNEGVTAFFRRQLAREGSAA